MKTAEEQLRSLLVPVKSCIKFITDEMQVTSYAIRGAYVLEASPDIIRLAEQAAPSDRKFFQIIKKITAPVSSTSEKLAEFRRGGFENFYRHSLISIWGAFEACIENLFVSAIKNDEQLFNAAKSCLKKWNISFFEMDDSDFRKLYRRIEKAIKNEDIYSVYDKILNIINLKISLSDVEKVAFVEANAVRNCVLHAASIVDEMAVERAPSLQQHICKSIKINKIEYHAYTNVVINILMQISVLIMTGEYAKKIKEEFELGRKWPGT
ncbi:MAG: hypothetical protein GYA47_08450 [Desulfovibrio sp.]|nr:hypothetical protein [Desulfovibrio sp.]